MIYIVYFLILLLLINLYFFIAEKYRIIDNPCERSSHTKPVLRGGGIIIPLGTLLYYFYADEPLIGFISGLLLIASISFIDDVRHVPSWLRFLVHLVALVLLFIQLDLLYQPWWFVVSALIVAAGIINIFNFMDGINGITGLYSLSILVSLWVVNNGGIVFTNNEFIYTSIIALMVFGIYNFRTKARCFAGDVGSVSFAFILIFLLFKLIISSGSFLYLMFVGMYLMDAGLTIMSRILRGENIFKAHRQHLYQVLANEAGYNHLLVAGVYAALQFLMNLAVIYFFPAAPSMVSFAMVILFMGGFSFVYFMLKHRYPTDRIRSG